MDLLLLVRKLFTLRLWSKQHHVGHSGPRRIRGYCPKCYDKLSRVSDRRYRLPTGGDNDDDNDDDDDGDDDDDDDDEGCYFSSGNPQKSSIIIKQERANRNVGGSKFLFSNRASKCRLLQCVRR